MSSWDQFKKTKSVTPVSPAPIYTSAREALQNAPLVPEVMAKRETVTPPAPQSIPRSFSPTIQAVTGYNRATATSPTGLVNNRSGVADFRRLDSSLSAQAADKRRKEEEAMRKKEAEARLKELEKRQRELVKSQGMKSPANYDPAVRSEIQRIADERMALQAQTRPGAQGFVEGVALNMTRDAIDSISGPQARAAREQTRETTPYKAMNVVGNLTTQAGIYGAANSAVKALGIGSKAAGGSALKAFAGAQGIDLLLDTMIQTPQEIFRAVREDKTLSETAKEIGVNRLIDVGINLAIGGVANSKQIRDFFRSLPQKQVAESVERVAKQNNIQPQEVRGIMSSLLPDEAALASRSNMQRTVGTLSPLGDDVVDGSTSVARNISMPEVRRPAGEAVLTEMPSPNRAMVSPDAPVGAGQVRERGFSENIRTDANRVDEVRASFDKDPAFYNVLNNADTLESATRRFDKGFDKALLDFTRTKGELRADNVPLAKLLADEAARRGDLTTARQVLADAAEMLTQAGQFSQAAKILRDSNDPGAVLEYLTRELKKLNLQGSKRYGKKWQDIVFSDQDDALIKQITAGATDEQKDEILKQLYANISNQIPVTRREQFDALRRVSMLLNPKTHVRNIAGNAIMGVMKRVSDTIAIAGEQAIPKEMRTKSLKRAPELVEKAAKYWETHADEILGPSRWEIFGVKSPFSDKRLFNNNLLETLHRFSGDALNVPDVMFYKHHFTYDLAGFMQARGLKEPTQEAIDYAQRRAAEATFKQINELAQTINRWKRGRGGLLVEAAIPFTTTPANIVKTGIEYSPINLVASVFRMITGGADPAYTVEALSKGLTGTGLAGLGYWLAMNGLARGDYRSNAREEGLLEAAGILPNSIILPNGSYSVDWIQPTAIPFFMGVAAAEEVAKQRGEDMTAAEAMQVGFNALTAAGDTVINQTMLRGVKDLFEGYGSTTEKIAKLPAAYVMQLSPTVGGQIARTIDPVRRQRDYSTDIDSILSNVQSRTPGLTQSMPARRDIYGEVQRYNSNPMMNAFNQFLNPGTPAEPTSPEITSELMAVYRSEGTDFLPRRNIRSFSADGTKYELDSNEMMEFQRVMGEYTKVALNSLFESQSYKISPANRKAELIKEITEEAYDRGKQAIIAQRKQGQAPN